MWTSMILLPLLWAALMLAAPIGPVENVGGTLHIPDPDLCEHKINELEVEGKKYLVPKDSAGVPLKLNWLEARNVCRRQCMDSIAVNTYQKQRIIKHFTTANLTSVWTSGRLCDFKGCRDSVNPNRDTDWFWSSEDGGYLPHVRITPPEGSKNPWGRKGSLDHSQPDNAEYLKNHETQENCISVFDNIFEEGLTLHDLACYQKLSVVCEDSEQLLAYAKKVSE